MKTSLPKKHLPTAMKRSSQGGSSPAPKLLLFDDESEHSSEDLYQFPSQSTISSNITLNDLADIFHSSPSSGLFHPGPAFLDNSWNDDTNSETEQNYRFLPDCYSSSETSQEGSITTRFSLDDALDESVTNVGASKTASKILGNSAIREEIVKLIFTEAHSSLKASLKDSILTAKKDKREYLLSLTPRRLCQEFQDNSNPAFQLLVTGLLGLANPEDIFASQHLLNNVAMLYSSISKEGIAIRK